MVVASDRAPLGEVRSPPSTNASTNVDVLVDADTNDEADGEALDARRKSGQPDVDSGADSSTSTAATAAADRVRRWSWNLTVIYGVLPAVALILALAAGFLKWQGNSAGLAQADSKQAATTAAESTIALLSYGADTAQKDLTAAEDRLTGDFRKSYGDLIDHVVIPGAKEKHISSQATVPAAATMSINDKNAVVLVFVNQTVSIGSDPPTSTASSVKITLDKVDDRWLIAQFDPV